MATCNCPPLYTEATQGVCTSLIPGLPQLACNTTQNPVSQAGQGAAQAVGQASIPGLTGLLAALGILTSPTTWVRVGLFVAALVILIIGFAIAVSGEGE